MIEIQNLTFGYNKQASQEFEQTTLTFEENKVYGLLGMNGTGKSTLLEGIAVAYGYNPEGGTKNYHFSTYHDVSELEEAIRLVKGYRKRNSGYFFRAESFFNVATVTKLQYNDDG